MTRRLRVVVTWLILTAVALPAPPATATHHCDALCSRVRTELRTFTRWLQRYDVDGYIGEVGWPDGTDAHRWNTVAEIWFRDADRAGLDVTTWATGEWWGTDYALAPYENRSGPRGVDARNTQARVVERHGTVPRGHRRGVSVAGAEFGAPVVEPFSSFSNVSPGTAETAYHHESYATFEFLASRGVHLVRIPLRWERIQPRLQRGLDRDEVRRLRRTVRRAHRAGLKVVIDMHNYGGYYRFDGKRGVRRALGTAHLPARSFVDVWRRLSAALEDERAIYAYGLMNEPVGMSSGRFRSPAHKWERISARAVRAIRARGDRTRVAVAGYQWSGVQRWTEQHRRPWIDDRRVVYEAHHYWDRDNSGDYPDSYDAEVVDARARGF